jgi:hypothetical protein
MASTIGTSHIAASQPCQDSHGCSILRDSSGRQVMLLVASDGAGSASVADIGSALACDTFVKLVADYLANGGRVKDITRPLVERWIAGIVYGFGLHARTRGLELGDYACTLLAAIVDEDVAAFLQIGDGAIVHSDGIGGWSWVFWPQHGEFANTTNFITSDNVKEAIAFQTNLRPFEEIAIFTDGLENLVLRKAEKEVHGPFFDSMFRSVRRSTASGMDDGLCRELEKYLASQPINARTDDDKTLILASRRLEHAVAAGGGS